MFQTIRQSQLGMSGVNSTGSDLLDSFYYPVQQATCFYGKLAIDTNTLAKVNNLKTLTAFSVLADRDLYDQCCIKEKRVKYYSLRKYFIENYYEPLFRKSKYSAIARLASTLTSDRLAMNRTTCSYSDFV